MAKSAQELLLEMEFSEKDRRQEVFKARLEDIKTTAYQIENKAGTLFHDGLSEDQHEAECAFLLDKNMELFTLMQELLWLLNNENKDGNSLDKHNDFCLDMFSITGNTSEGFEITGPLLPKKRKFISDKNTLQMAISLKNTVKNYLEKERITPPAYENADIVFTFNVPETFPELHVRDADNLDIKPFLDALGMLLIEDDSMASITYTIWLNRSNDISAPHTTITILPQRVILSTLKTVKKGGSFSHFLAGKK